MGKMETKEARARVEALCLELHQIVEVSDLQFYCMYSFDSEDIYSIASACSKDGLVVMVQSIKHDSGNPLNEALAFSGSIQTPNND